MKKKIIIILTISIVLILLIINYIMVSNIDIKLIGRDNISLNINDNWIDPGYIVKDSYKDKVNVSSNLDLNKIGNYKITYSIRLGIFSKKIKREINVLPREEYGDTIVNMMGDNPYYLMNGSEYFEHGVRARDIYDGLIDKVVITNNIDNRTDGTYEVTYEVTSNNGVVKKYTREVIVYSFNFTSKTKYIEYSQDNEITLSIDDNQYSYTILPDNQKSTNRNITYPVDENGLYTFNIYDKNDNVFKYEVNINNIDKIIPTGSCTLYLNNTNGVIKVDAHDNNEILGYEYIYGNETTPLSNEKEYLINTLDETATVNIIDVAKNSNIIKCNTIDNSTKIANTYELKDYEYNGKKHQYWLYSPINNTLRKKMPLVVYFHGDGGRKSPDAVNLYGLPKYMKVGSSYPFYMVAPYCNNYTDFSSDAYMDFVMDLINYMIKNYNVDPDRIIISGGSSGARGAYTIASKNKIFSCMVIISGITYQLYHDKEQNLTYLPIWIFHGRYDQAVNYNDVKYHVDNINGYGGNVLFTTYEGGHDSTDQAFENQEVIDWMVKQKRR